MPALSNGGMIKHMTDQLGITRFFSARLFGAAIVLIAFALAPSVALAHSGHNHHAPAVSSSQPAPAADVAAAQKDTDKVLAFEWRTSSNDSDAGSKQPACAMGCCSGLSCTACSATIAPESLGVRLFGMRLIFEFPETPVRNGVSLGGLRRPPRTFA